MLVERHQNHAYALALRIVRSRDDAEEVAQDAFVRAWKALPGFRGDAKFSTWLHRIVAHRALDRAVALRKRRGREQELTDAIEELAGSVSDDPGQRLRLEGVIGSLSESQRAVVTLYYYEDKSVDEVALALGMPTGTVKTHLRRARAALRTAWLEEEAKNA